MPGLAGYCGERAPAMVMKMVRSLRHRSTYVESCFVADQHCAISRMDFEWTDQHSCTFNDRGISVTLSGEIFNLDDVVRSSGVRARNAAEFISELVRSDGPLDHLAEIDGLFFAVILDRTTETVTLVMDRYGLRHLYMTEGRDYVGFASDVKALLGLGANEDPISEAGVSAFWHEGAFTDNGTWFENISLLPPASITEICAARAEVRSQRVYWEPTSRDTDGTFDGDQDAASEQLGFLFRRAVERRIPEEEFVVPLSGGLDSRAIVAAIPQNRSFASITFGQMDCGDYRIAKRVSKLRGCRNDFFEISEGNWLDSRIAGVWWTDGQLNLLHMHAFGRQMQRSIKQRASISGYLGDGILGGLYLKDRGTTMWDNITGPGRRRVSEGPRIGNIHLDYGTRCPFIENSLVDFVLTLPRDWLTDSGIYNRMLLREFPQYFRTIPWQKTGYPISYPYWYVSNMVRARRHLRKVARPLLHDRIDRKRLANYAVWTRQGDGRELFEKLLFSKSALYPCIIPRDQVQRVWEQHLKGRNEAIKLGRFVTIEIWLQQVFNRRFRPDPDQHDFGVSPRQVIAMLS